MDQKCIIEGVITNLLCSSLCSVNSFTDVDVKIAACGENAFWGHRGIFFAAVPRVATMPDWKHLAARSRAWCTIFLYRRAMHSLHMSVVFHWARQMYCYGYWRASCARTEERVKPNFPNPDILAWQRWVLTTAMPVVYGHYDIISCFLTRYGVVGYSWRLQQI